MGSRIITEFTCDVCKKVETDPAKVKSWRNVSCAPVPIPLDPTVMFDGGLTEAQVEPTAAAVVCGKGCRNKWNAALDAPPKAPATG